MSDDRHNQLHEIVVGDTSASWESAGFRVDDGVAVIGNTAIRLTGDANGRGIRSIGVDGVEGPIDGCTIHQADPAPPAQNHPNGVNHIDHLVVMTGDCDRTTAALESAGIEARRVRRFSIGGTQRRQTFFWLGDVILELVGPDEPSGNDPAHLWGLALASADLDQTAAALDGRCTPPKDAVQPGRRITTIATRDLDISTALAVLSPHPRDVDER